MSLFPQMDDLPDKEDPIQESKDRVLAAMLSYPDGRNLYRITQLAMKVCDAEGPKL